MLLVTDSAFVAGNLTKVPNGGWIPLTLGALLYVIFTTWRNGRLELRAALAKLAVPRTELGKLVAGVHRVPGTGVFLASNANLVPSALIRNIEHNCVVHQRVIILNVEIADTPRQDPVRRLRIEEPVPSVHFITARFGFMETPDVARGAQGLPRARPARVHARTAPSSSAATWCARGRCRACAACSGGCLRACSSTVPRPRNSSACRSATS